MSSLLDIAVKAARLAGQAIMEVYAQPFEVFIKEDASPVTLADLRASDIIKETLKESGLPFISEEDLPPDRSQFGRYWLVDPLDGTKEFVNRNGEFTVNIALIENKRPILGVIYAPVLDSLWRVESGKWKVQNGKLSTLHSPLSQCWSVVPTAPRKLMNILKRCYGRYILIWSSTVRGAA